jgi:hypothetical protein
MTPEDEESLLAAIETVARDRASFSRGRDYVARHFDRDVLAHRLLDELVAITTPTPATISFPAPVLAEPATAATGDAPPETAPQRRAAA